MNKILGAELLKHMGYGHDESKSAGDWAMLLDKIKGKQCQAVWDRDWDNGEDFVWVNTHAGTT